MNAIVSALSPAASSSASRSTQPLPTPAQLRARMPASAQSSATVKYGREAIRAIMQGDDPRLLVIAGPCSLHDPDAALEYAERLANLASRVGDQMLL
ncbi:MAG: phospho-2-dehydro-3-deoxyheptonate aldolase, partial [Pseudomonadales bacterium]|nr:phospho-2-dehydro-3-deoxyheptonate aldolase [Pseudomonadales bacterium]